MRRKVTPTDDEKVTHTKNKASQPTVKAEDAHEDMVNDSVLVKKLMRNNAET